MTTQMTEAEQKVYDKYHDNRNRCCLAVNNARTRLQYKEYAYAAAVGAMAALNAFLKCRNEEGAKQMTAAEQKVYDKYIADRDAAEQAFKNAEGQLEYDSAQDIRASGAWDALIDFLNCRNEERAKELAQAASGT
ncbi:MAG: hypothetical protein WA211_10075 [Candidatus Acidiferrales bacterium]